MEHRTNILITRPRSSLHSALPLLPRERFNVCPCPTISMRAVRKDSSLDKLFGRISTFDFAIFTSQTAVVETANYLSSLGVDLQQLNRLCVCAVGPVTAQSLSRFGIEADIIPHQYTAQALANLFPVMRTHAPKVLFPRGNLASNVLAEALVRKGYQLASPILYETETLVQLGDNASRLINTGPVHCIAFTSPSSVIALKTLIGEDGFGALCESATVAAIGPVTAGACVKAGARVEIQPDDYTLRALAKDIARHFVNGPQPFNDRSTSVNMSPE